MEAPAGPHVVCETFGKDRTMVLRWARNHLSAFGWLIVAALLLPAAARADESVLETSAVRFLPADGAFFVSFLRNRQQYEAFVESNAFAHWKKIGYARKMLEEIENEGGWQKFQQAQNDPMMGPIVKLVLDGLSNEVFFYGGIEYTDVIDSLQQLSLAVNTAQFRALVSGGQPEQAQLQAMLDFVKDLPDGANVPPTLIGFRISDGNNAKGLLNQLDQMAQQMAQVQPMFQGRVERKKFGQGDYVTLRLDGSMIPWNEVEDEFPGDASDFEKLKAKLEKKTLLAAVGIYDNYLLIYFGADASTLQKLGSGPSLASRPEFAKVLPLAHQPITMLSYVSDDYMKRAANPASQVQQLASIANSVLEAAPVDDDLKQEIQDDLKRLLQKIESSMPKPGAVLSYCYLDGTGYTSATFNWGSMRLDGSKPLGVLQHVGGNPLGFFAARPKYDASDYEAFAEVVERLIYYGDKIADANLEGKEKELYGDLRNAIVPLLERLDKANREYLLPAFKGADSAIVVDAKTTSKAWTAFMPPAETPLPMIELGIVDSVNSADQVKKGCSEYFAVLQEALNRLHDISTKYPELFPGPIPQIEIPSPQTREIAGGTVYYYSLPPQAALDPQLAPNAGLNDQVGVVSLIPKFTARLMESKSLTGDVAEFASKKAGAAYYFNFAGFIDALLPWADYAAMFMGAVNVAAEQGQQDDLLTQIRETAKVLKCLKSFHGITTQEGDVWVTRGKVVIQDLPN